MMIQDFVQTMGNVRICEYVKKVRLAVIGRQVGF